MKSRFAPVFLAAFALALNLSPCAAAMPAGDTDCPSAARLAEARSAFTIDDDKLPFRACDPSNLPYMTAKALVLLKETSRDFTSANPFGPGILGDDPYGFFASRVKTIQLHASCRNGIAGYHLPGRQKKVHVCPAIAERGVVHLAATLIHEARHEDGHAHVRCDRGSPQIRGEEGCDGTYEDGGAHAAGLEYGIGLIRMASVSSNLKREARRTIINDLRWAFNRLPGDLREGAVLRLESGELSFYDGESTHSLLAKLPAGTVPEVGVEGLLRFIGSGPKHYFEYGYGHRIAGVTMTPSPFPELDADQRARFRDFRQIGTVRCILFTDSLSCAPPSGFAQARHVRVPGGDAVSIASVEASVRWLGAERDSLPYVLTRDGTAYEFPSSWTDFEAQGALKRGGDLGARAAIEWHGPRFVPYLLKLTPDGSVHIAENGRGEKTAPGTEGLQVRRLVGPLVWSETLDQLLGRAGS